MDEDKKHLKNQVDGDLLLPEEAGSVKHSPSKKSSEAAANLVRKKVEAAYAHEPSAQTEASDIKSLGSSTKRSKHQQFIYDLTSSGKTLAEIQAAWHEYYAGLTDAQKHDVWQEFYATHTKASHYTAAQHSPHQSQENHRPAIVPSAIRPRSPEKTFARSAEEFRDYILGNVSSKKKVKPMQHLQSLLFGLGVGSMVVLIFLFSFFNERFIAPFIQPSRTLSNAPIIADGAAVGSNAAIVIPKINVEIPVVYDVPTINEDDIQNALEGGVVHYADTAIPGQNGNVVIVGHSSNNIFNKGKYKFAFVLLSRLENGDTFYLQKDGKRYTYQIYKKAIVKPTDISVLGTSDKGATATLITCDPPGTSTNRLVVVGQQISPDPGVNLAQTTTNNVATKSAIIPGNSPSLWSRFVKWFAS